MMDARAAYKLLHRHARNALKCLRDDRGMDVSSPACFAADMALDNVVQNLDMDWREFLDPRQVLFAEDGREFDGSSIHRAVLWALHWYHCKPTRQVPMWSSEVRLCFELGPDMSRVWFSRARLPG